VPFFWTDQHMVITDYVGHARQWEEIVFDGDPGEREFVAYYVKDGRVPAAAGCGQDRRMGAIAEIIRAEGMPTVERLRTGAAEMLEVLKT